MLLNIENCKWMYLWPEEVIYLEFKYFAITII